MLQFFRCNKSYLCKKMTIMRYALVFLDAMNLVCVKNDNYEVCSSFLDAINLVCVKNDNYEVCPPVSSSVSSSPRLSPFLPSIILLFLAKPDPYILPVLLTFYSGKLETLRWFTPTEVSKMVDLLSIQIKQHFIAIELFKTEIFHISLLFSLPFYIWECIC